MGRCSITEARFSVLSTEGRCNVYRRLAAASGALGRVCSFDRAGTEWKHHYPHFISHLLGDADESWEGVEVGGGVESGGNGLVALASVAVAVCLFVYLLG